jgi:hypothetical protein
MDRLKKGLLKLASFSLVGIAQIKYGPPTLTSQPESPGVILHPLYGIPYPVHELTTTERVYNFALLNFSWLVGLFGALLLGLYLGIKISQRGGKKL